VADEAPGTLERCSAYGHYAGRQHAGAHLKVT